jgi:histidine triad (HIT) family protein
MVGAQWHCALTKINNMLLKIARSPLGQSVVGFVFAHLSFLLPVKRIYESASLMAFHHPRPSYATHVLIVPKQSISCMANLNNSDSQLLIEVIQAASNIVDRLALQDRRTQLILNAGAYQEVPQLHFHLITTE